MKLDIGQEVKERGIKRWRDSVKTEERACTCGVYGRRKEVREQMDVKA